MKKMALALIMLLIAAASAYGGTIYIWTDENGVKRFSDAPPPKGIENYETAEGSTSKPAEGQREGLTKMLEEQKQQSQEEDAKKEAEEAAREAEQKRNAQAEKKAKTQPERDHLQKQINDLQNRALSPTFTEGMRQNQIEKIQKQIDALSN